MSIKIQKAAVLLAASAAAANLCAVSQAQTEEKVELGRRLFYDTRLSVTGTHSCATCY